MAVDLDSPARRSFLRRHGLPITVGILFLATLGFMATRVTQQADQGIREPLQSFLDRLAAASPAANSTLQAYYAQFRRDNVASVDFLALCTTMMNQPQQQGVDVDAISPNIAQGCRSGGALPPEFFSRNREGF